MNAVLHQPAIWDDTHKQRDGKGPIQTGEQRICSIICDGVEFKSWLPRSKEHADQINAAAAKLVAHPDADISSERALADRLAVVLQFSVDCQESCAIDMTEDDWIECRRALGAWREKRGLAPVKPVEGK